MRQKKDLLSQSLEEYYMHCVVLVTFMRERKEKKELLFKQTLKVTFRMITSFMSRVGQSTIASKVMSCKLSSSYEKKKE